MIPFEIARKAFQERQGEKFIEENVERFSSENFVQHQSRKFRRIACNSKLSF